MLWCPVKFKNVAFGIDDPAGHARKYPPTDGPTAVTEASTATAPAGIAHPPALPPCAANAEPDPVTANDRCVPFPNVPPATRVSTIRHGVIPTYPAVEPAVAK